MLKTVADSVAMAVPLPPSTNEGFFSKSELAWLQAIKRHPLFKIHPFYSNDCNLLRWAHAYGGDIEIAIRKYRRHLRIREILQLDAIESFAEIDGLDEAADHYAPMTILGEVSPSDHRILLFEQSGRFDLGTMMRTIRTSTFMTNRFRLMERVLNQIQVAEKRTGRLLSSVLVIDLHGLKFQSNLIGFISGPYRIMWGTLIEQYPSLISKIVVINFPTFMSILWAACSQFIPEEYKKRIFIFGDNWRDKITTHIPLESFPVAYGGLREITIVPPGPCRISTPESALSVSESSLDSISIPAGGFIVHTFYLVGEENLEFYIKHDKEFTMNIFFSPTKVNIKNYPSDVDDQMFDEVFAGCERPGLPTLDFWTWRVPQTGFYYAIFGNEKAWIMSVNVKYQIYQTHPNGSKIRVNPLPSNEE